MPPVADQGTTMDGLAALTAHSQVKLPGNRTGALQSETKAVNLSNCCHRQMAEEEEISHNI